MRKDKEWLKREIYAEYNDSDFIQEVWGLIDQLDEPKKPVIPKFVADWIESQDDPIYEMCVNYEMWGVNGDDGTTRFTGELAEWFDDTLNVENYYRACIDGYEVEKEKLYRIKFSDNQYASRFNDEKISSVLTDKELAVQYTEKEIKAIDERFWAFAEPIDDIE